MTDPPDKCRTWIRDRYENQTRVLQKPFDLFNPFTESGQGQEQDEDVLNPTPINTYCMTVRPHVYTIFNDTVY